MTIKGQHCVNGRRRRRKTKEEHQQNQGKIRLTYRTATPTPEFGHAWRPRTAESREDD